MRKINFGHPTFAALSFAVSCGRSFTYIYLNICVVMVKRIFTKIVLMAKDVHETIRKILLLLLLVLLLKLAILAILLIPSSASVCEEHVQKPLRL